MTRQCINTGVRLALYEPTKDFYLHQEKSTINSNIGISGGTVGFIGAIITHPVDVVKSHTQAYNSSIIKNTKKYFFNYGCYWFFRTKTKIMENDSITSNYLWCIRTSV